MLILSRDPPNLNPHHNFITMTSSDTSFEKRHAIAESRRGSTKTRNKVVLPHQALNNKSVESEQTAAPLEHTKVIMRTTPVLLGWNPNKAKLAKLPLYYPSGLIKYKLPTRLFVALLGALQTFLKHKSIQATFHNVPCFAMLQTMDQVKLRIKFWEACDDSEHMIVDIQRSSGDQIKFGRVLRQLICVAKGIAGYEAADDKSAAMHDEINILPVELNVDKIRQLEAIAEQPAPPIKREVVISETSAMVPVIQMIHQCLTSPSFAERTMGLEIFLNLTNVGTTIVSAACHAALIFLLGQAPLDAGRTPQEQECLDRKCQEIQRVLLVILQCRCYQGDEELRHRLAAYSDDASDVLESSCGQYNQRKKRGQYETAMMSSIHKVLTAMVNSLEVLLSYSIKSPLEVLDDSSSIVVQFLQKCKELTETDIYQTLMEFIDGSEAEMAVAFLACKAMRLLLVLFPPLQEELQGDRRAQRSIEKACRTGSMWHSLLEVESKKLRGSILP